MTSIRKISPARGGVVIFYLLTILMNYISQAIPFNGQTNGEVSDKYATLITPAGYAFSIWGVIFLALGAYAYFQAFVADSSTKIYDSIAPWLIVAFIATSAWLPVFQYEMISFSVIFMLIILGSLIQISIMLTKDRTLSRRENALVRIPFGLYLGWISVATIVNISVLAKYTQWNLLGISEANWLLIMITVGFVLAVLVSVATGNLVYSLVFVWAFVAVAVKHQDDTTLWGYSLVLAASLFIFTLTFAVRWYRQGQLVEA